MTAVVDKMSNRSKQWLQTALFLTLVVIFPLLPKPALLFSWPIALALLTGFVLNLTQPPFRAEDTHRKGEHDGRSIFVLLLAGLLVFLIPVLEYGYFHPFTPPLFSQLSMLGIGIIAAGLGFRYIAIRTLGRFFTARVEVIEGKTLIDHGPYRHLRHPSYTGSLLMAVGLGLAFRSWFGLTIGIAIFILAYRYRIRVEEEALVKELGDTYRDYQKRTRRLIPGLY